MSTLSPSLPALTSPASSIVERNKDKGFLDVDWIISELLKERDVILRNAAAAAGGVDEEAAKPAINKQKKQRSSEKVVKKLR